MFSSNPFRNQESGIVKRRMVEQQERMNAMREIAPKHGVTLTILNKPGEKYTTDEGLSFDLEHNNYYVELSSGLDLTDFWKEVNEVTPVKKDALFQLTDELIANLKNGTAEKADLIHLQAILNERIAYKEAKDKKYNVEGDKNKLPENSQSSKQFHSYGKPLSEQSLKIMQEVADKYGISIKITGKPGGDYYSNEGYYGKFKTLKDGEFSVDIGTKLEDWKKIRDFWEEFRIKTEGGGEER